jgi:hypothetical protein
MITVGISPETITVGYGDTYFITSVVTVPEGYTAEFEWLIDKKYVGTYGQTFQIQASHIGSFNIASRVRLTSPTGEVNYYESPACNVTILKRSMMDDIDAEVIYPVKPVYRIGETIKMEVKVNHPDPDHITGVLWKNQYGDIIGIGRFYEHTIMEMHDVVNVKVDVASEMVNYFTKYMTFILEGVEIPESDDCIRYIHPLDHRDSAYIWCGWWVMDEIERSFVEGVDWKNPDGTDLKYQCDLKTLSKMLTVYPNVEVQESRNGYFVNRAMLESGDIYKAPYAK